MKYNCLSLGPARMDAFVKLPEDSYSEKCTIDRKRCVIEMGFGEKISVKGVDFAIGGNAGNNAVGLSRLGFSTALIGAMGDGWMDQKAINELKEEKVEMKYVEINKGQNGFGVVINYQEERTILSYYPDALCCFPEDKELEADWVYFTSMGQNYESFYQQAVDWVTSHNARIVFNPGTRQLKSGIEHLRFVLEKTQILILNREEANLLLQVNPKSQTTNPKDLMQELQKLGPKHIVLTDGASGAYSYKEGKCYFVPIINTPVVERTGAGDAFGVGFMAATMKGLSETEALLWGTVNSASVLGFVGPQAGLLTEEKMKDWLAKSGDVKVIEV